jgi:hypothetical protein
MRSPGRRRAPQHLELRESWQCSPGFSAASPAPRHLGSPLGRPRNHSAARAPPSRTHPSTGALRVPRVGRHAEVTLAGPSTLGAPPHQDPRRWRRRHFWSTWRCYLPEAAALPTPHPQRLRISWYGCGVALTKGSPICAHGPRRPGNNSKRGGWRTSGLRRRPFSVGPRGPLRASPHAGKILRPGSVPPIIGPALPRTSRRAAPAPGTNPREEGWDT